MRVVIKVGTSTLAHAGGRLNIRRVELLCKVLSDIKNAGHQVVLVSSGAIGMGVGKLGLPGRPQDMPGKQAAAAVGQCELMYAYDKLFSQYSHTVAQILLTAEDIYHPRRSSHVHDTITRLLEWNALPIINENDAVATDEIGIQTTIGENDSLSAIVAKLVDADLLILLSDIEGLYTADLLHPVIIKDNLCYYIGIFELSLGFSVCKTTLSVLAIMIYNTCDAFLRICFRKSL